MVLLSSIDCWLLLQATVVRYIAVYTASCAWAFCYFPLVWDNNGNRKAPALGGSVGFQKSCNLACNTRWCCFCTVLGTTKFLIEAWPIIGIAINLSQGQGQAGLVLWPPYKVIKLTIIALLLVQYSTIFKKLICFSTADEITGLGREQLPPGLESLHCLVMDGFCSIWKVAPNFCMAECVSPAGWESFDTWTLGALLPVFAASKSVWWTIAFGQCWL